MRTFLRLIALIITLIAVLMLPFALFGFQIGQIIFSPQAMLNLVASEVIGPSQANIVAQTLLQSLPVEWGIDTQSTLGQALTAATQQTAVQTALLPMDLQIEYAAQGIDSFYTWMDSTDPMPILELDMLPLKSHYSQNAGSLVNNILTMLPLCTAEESLALVGTVFDALLGGEAVLETIPSCLPAIIPVETIAPAAGELLRGQIALIPDTVVLDNLVQATPQRMQEIKSSLQLTKGALQWSWLPILFLLLIAALVGGQTKEGVPAWFGSSLVAGGILTFLITLVPSSWWLALIIPQLTGWSLILQVPAVALSGLIFEMAGEATVWLAAAVAILGILFLFLAFFLRRSVKKSAF